MKGPNLSACLFWRRKDVQGLERLELEVTPERITASGSLICLEQGGFRLDHHWLLTPDWRTQFVSIERWNSTHAQITVERNGKGWRVNGVHDPAFDGAEEPDLSVTPFCNTFPIRRTPHVPGAGLTLDTLYIDGANLEVTRSSQRYVRKGSGQLRYVDLGISRGFEADLQVDDLGLVLSYEHLFERIASPA